MILVDIDERLTKAPRRLSSSAFVLTDHIYAQW